MARVFRSFGRKGFPLAQGGSGPTRPRQPSVVARPRRRSRAPRRTSRQRLRLIEHAVARLRRGGVVAVPTDTVWGFATDATRAEGIHAVYSVKGRPFSKPLAICVGAVSAVADFAECDALPQSLLRSLLPGPVTVCLRRAGSAAGAALANGTISDTDTVAIRVLPANSTVSALCLGLTTDTSPGVLALTSANSSGDGDSHFPRDFEPLWPQIDAVVLGVVDGTEGVTGGVDVIGTGSCRFSSTIVDLSTPDAYRIIRPGNPAVEARVRRECERHDLVDSAA